MTFIVYGNSCKFVINHIVQFFFFFLMSLVLATQMCGFIYLFLDLAELL